MLTSSILIILGQTRSAMSFMSSGLVIPLLQVFIVGGLLLPTQRLSTEKDD